MVFLWIIFTLSTLGLMYVLGSKIPALRVIDVSTFPGSKERQLKHTIALRQMEKRAAVLWRGPMSLLWHFFSIAQQSFRAFARRIKELERVYQAQARGAHKVTVDKPTLDAMAREASALVEAEKYEEAEKMLVEILSCDNKYAQAYESLGRLYIVQKEFDHAREALSMVLKLQPKDASAHAAMGELERGRGRGAEALAAFTKAVEYSPNNPKYLDFLIESALHEKKMDVAQATLERLEEVNPGNKKIAEYKQKVAL